ncbi:sulfotransferase domain-containing protein [Shewanella basaltis]|uniref:sulfotransferase domain-containing protein n=1 Tax=Shewanella basaltis TaxID=472183 RepID=UPI003AAE3ABB
MGNILWVASYPKSGNTWVRAFLENYIQNQDQPVDINTMHTLSTAESAAHRYQAYLPKDKTSTTELSLDEISILRPQVQADIAHQAQGTTFVKTHNYLGEYNGQPLHNYSVTSGAIYVVRNPLDVVISMANYFDYTIDEAIAYMAEEMTGTPNEVSHVPQIITSWSMHVSSWTSDDSSRLILRYEDMLDDPKKAFRKVESFLGLKKDPARLKNAIKHSSFAQLKAQEAKRGFVEKHENANAFFRQGGKHQWQAKLTPEQVKRIVDTHYEQMKRFKYLPAGM